MKTCRCCGFPLEDGAFTRDVKRKDGLALYCRGCTRKKGKASYAKNKNPYLQRNREWADKRREENRRFLWEYKSRHPCVDCGETDPRVLQFDHVKGEKDESLTVLAYGRKAPIEALTVEIAKCVVRCANCHIRKTWSDRGYRTPEGPSRKRSRKSLPQDRVEHLRRRREQGASYGQLGEEFRVSQGTAWRIVNSPTRKEEEARNGKQDDFSEPFQGSGS